MKIFIVISTSTEEFEAVVKQTFHDFNENIIPGVWAVATADKSLSDVCDALGINPEGKNPGVILNLDSYHGYYGPTLWDKFNEWVKA